VAFQTCGERKVAEIWLKNLRERDQFIDSSTDRRIIKKKIFSRSEMSACIGLIWLRTGTGRKILAMR
jgi:hypothetical protein